MDSKTMFALGLILTSAVGCVHTLTLGRLTDPGRIEILMLDIYSNDELFEMFKSEYGKTYSSPTEEHYRRTIFVQNVEIIRKHNYRYMARETTFFLGRGEYTDLTLNELLGTNGKNHVTANSHVKTLGKPYTVTSNAQLPDSMDWRKNGSVTSVKSQGKCKSGYAFSAVGALEAQFYLSTKQLISFSTQQPVDCPSGQPNLTSSACAGGNPLDAYESIIVSGGEETEADYPYEGKNGTCRFNSTSARTAIMGYSYGIPDEGFLQRVVSEAGPVSVQIDANHTSFLNYKGGIYNEPNCSNTTTNHAVLVVGYGFEINAGNRTDYWIVKNSFGTSWGKQGYIRMIRNHFNQCGIINNASLPLL